MVQRFPALFAAALGMFLAGGAEAQAPTLPQTLPPNTVVGRLGIGPGPAQAIPFATLLINSVSVASPITTAPQVGLFFIDPTQPMLVTGGVSQLDHIRCSQANGQPNKYLITATTGTVTCLDFEIENEAGSNAASNVYGVIGVSSTLGPGSAKGVYGRGQSLSGAVGPAFGIVGALNVNAASNAFSSAGQLDMSGGVDDVGNWMQLESSGGNRLITGFYSPGPINFKTAWAQIWMGSGSAAGADAIAILNNGGGKIANWDSAGNIFVPQILGGSAAASAMVVSSTNNVSPSGDLIAIRASSIFFQTVGGGTAKGEIFPSGGWYIGNSPADPGGTNLTVQGFIRTVPTVFASLPACAAGNQGARAFITDSNSVVYHATAAGGGANKMGVLCDGTNWYVD